MKKIIISLSMMAVVAAIAVGATTAFFSDTETSTGNTFTAGAIDLKIDNESYVTSTTTGQLIASLGTTWDLRDLTIEKFFDFVDLKPGDMGEDTISLHVNNNDSWLCADLSLTSDNDNSITEPEKEDGDADIAPGIGLGELANRVRFIWWADDGDNVLETCEGSQAQPCVPETVLNMGPLSNLGIGATTTVALADSTGGIWGSSPVPGGSDRFIGKAWCFGALTPTPVVQDGLGKTGTPQNPTNILNGPLSGRGTGFTCNGAGEDNKTQTDSMTVDVSFRAEQSRNNPNFRCNQ